MRLPESLSISKGGREGMPESLSISKGGREGMRLTEGRRGQ